MMAQLGVSLASGIPSQASERSYRQGYTSIPGGLILANRTLP